MPIYTRADLKARINAGIKNKIGLLTDRDQTVNDAVRAVNAEADLRSTRRMVTIHPGIFDEVYAYPCPPDLKARRLVSLSTLNNPQDVYVGFNLIPYEQFNQKLVYQQSVSESGSTEVRFGNQREAYTVAFDDLSGIRRLLISAPISNNSQVLTALDSLTDGGGLWTSFGDAFNVDRDPGNFIRGTASIGFDISGAGGTTAGIYNATLNQFDISTMLESNNSFFVFMYLSDADDITNITLRVGNSGAVYYQMQVTQTHFDTQFQTGWNVLRFDASDITEVGSVDPTACDYMALFMTKAVGKINQTGFNFDHIVLRTGTIMQLRYYSKYPWQSQAGVWKEQSTADDDFLNVESDEYDMIVDKGIMVAGEEVDEGTASAAAQVRYDRKLALYSRGNPSEALVETSDYMAQYFI